MYQRSIPRKQMAPSRDMGSGGSSVPVLGIDTFDDFAKLSFTPETVTMPDNVQASPDRAAADLSRIEGFLLGAGKALPIRAVAERLGMVPELAAKALTRGESVGALVFSVEDGTTLVGLKAARAM